VEPGPEAIQLQKLPYLLVYFRLQLAVSFPALLGTGYRIRILYTFRRGIYGTFYRLDERAKKMKLPEKLAQKIKRGASGERVSLTPEDKNILKALTGRTVPCLCGGGKARRVYLKEAYRLYKQI